MRRVCVCVWFDFINISYAVAVAAHRMENFVHKWQVKAQWLDYAYAFFYASNDDYGI